MKLNEILSGLKRKLVQVGDIRTYDGREYEITAQRGTEYVVSYLKNGENHSWGRDTVAGDQLLSRSKELWQSLWEKS